MKSSLNEFYDKYRHLFTGFSFDPLREICVFEFDIKLDIETKEKILIDFDKLIKSDKIRNYIINFNYYNYYENI